MNSSDKFTFTPNINPTSQMIIGCKYQNSKMNVYERLHNDAKFKNQKKLVLNKENNPSAGQSTRYNTLQRPQSGDFSNNNNNKTLTKNNCNIYYLCIHYNYYS